MSKPDGWAAKKAKAFTIIAVKFPFPRDKQRYAGMRITHQDRNPLNAHHPTNKPKGKTESTL
jgi:hypothetical protein